MATKTLDKCKNGREFIHYAEAHGGYIDRQCGSHAIVKSPSGGTCPVPVHPGDMPTGTRCSIVKRFIAIGLGVFLLVFVIGPILQALI